MSPLVRTPTAIALAAVLAVACQKGPKDAEAEEVVRRYNALVTEAYRTGDFRVAQPVLGPDELRKVAAHVGVKLDQGITLDARLTEFKVEKVERKGDEVMVLTDERWHYLDRKIGTGEQVGQDSRDHYRMRYVLRQVDGKWVVDRTEFAEKPEVGRKQVPDQAPAAAFHGMDATQQPQAPATQQAPPQPPQPQAGEKK
jgi:hypothetical protein